MSEKPVKVEVVESGSDGGGCIILLVLIFILIKLDKIHNLLVEVLK
jgi:hypothetical protein